MQKLIVTRKGSKLNDLMAKHKSLIAQFESAGSVQDKFRALKSALLVYNSQSIKSIEVRNTKPKDSQEDTQETEEIYIRQLNKMCEGQEQFQEAKREELLQNRNKREKKDGGKEIANKKQYHSVHEERKWNKETANERKNYENEKMKKFLVLPNFNGDSTGLPIQTGLKRKLKRFKQNLFQKEWQVKPVSIWQTRKSKNSSLKKQIEILKQRAKNVYDLNFDNFETKEPQENPANEKEKATSEYITFYPLETKLENCKIIERFGQSKVKEGLKAIFNQEEKSESYEVPKEMLRKKQGCRPFSVGCNILRSKKIGGLKANYFRI